MGRGRLRSAERHVRPGDLGRPGTQARRRARRHGHQAGVLPSRCRLVVLCVGGPRAGELLAGVDQPRSGLAESVPSIPLHAVTQDVVRGRLETGARDDAGRQGRLRRGETLVPVRAGALRQAEVARREQGGAAAAVQGSARAAFDQRRSGRPASERRNRLGPASRADESLWQPMAHVHRGLRPQLSGRRARRRRAHGGDPFERSHIARDVAFGFRAVAAQGHREPRGTDRRLVHRPDVHDLSAGQAGREGRVDRSGARRAVRRLHATSRCAVRRRLESAARRRSQRTRRHSCRASAERRLEARSLRARRSGSLQAISERVLDHAWRRHRRAVSRWAAAGRGRRHHPGLLGGSQGADGEDRRAHGVPVARVAVIAARRAPDVRRQDVHGARPRGARAVSGPHRCGIRATSRCEPQDSMGLAEVRAPQAVSGLPAGGSGPPEEARLRGQRRGRVVPAVSQRTDGLDPPGGQFADVPLPRARGGSPPARRTQERRGGSSQDSVQPDCAGAVAPGFQRTTRGSPPSTDVSCRLSLR